ncbi:MerR family transcriptional regulator [Shewanella dokdonensis]|uniref:MerR family transcriptional regulator n=1 Tax=Shewanella dokdonensis TaxID=712036 RepID=A0ABX8DGG0_9GAMM|nr:MerR family transcriptional regulator [Shewanella dokdonensis]MCL1074085.1 MerR family transcriptional regulator [Shewanella dokdonensis]QVK23824.1 MerR family transcriptional regulator [Shewanella dokdonensis]
MKISELSKKTNVSIRMIRYYEEKGLLQPTRTNSGYRCFNNDDIELVDKIKFFKDIGFTIEEVRPILECQLGLQKREQICDKLKEKFASRVEQIDRMISGLNEAKLTLSQYI